MVMRPGNGILLPALLKPFPGRAVASRRARLDGVLIVPGMLTSRRVGSRTTARSALTVRLVLARALHLPMVAFVLLVMVRAELNGRDVLVEIALSCVCSALAKIVVDPMQRPVFDKD